MVMYNYVFSNISNGCIRHLKHKISLNLLLKLMLSLRLTKKICLAIKLTLVGLTLYTIVIVINIQQLLREEGT